MKVRVWVSAALLAMVALQVRAQTPSYDFTVVRADGEKNVISVMTNYSHEAIALLELLPERIRLGIQLDVPRVDLRSICLPGGVTSTDEAQPEQDTIIWQDGSSTTGFVVSITGVLEQNGRRLDKWLHEASCIQFGRSSPQELAAAYDPTEIDLLPRRPTATFWGTYAAFRWPWIEVTHDLVLIAGKDPIARGEIWVVAINSDTDHNYHHSPRVTEDTVVWTDGNKTTGTVLVRSGQVTQPNRAPRSLREVRYIEFAPPAGAGSHEDYAKARADCEQDEDADRQIAGCTIVANSGLEVRQVEGIALANRGFGYTKKGDAERALSDFAEAIRLYPRYPNAHWGRADIWVQRGAWHAAISDYTAALRIDPSDTYSLQRRARAYVKTGNLEDALKDANEAVRLAPNDAQAHVLKGEVHFERQEVPLASASFDHALELAPTLASALEGRSKVRAVHPPSSQPHP